jgi:dTDP-4-amino-4,6-dideoxygalactose transaminase
VARVSFSACTTQQWETHQTLRCRARQTESEKKRALNTVLEEVATAAGQLVQTLAEELQTYVQANSSFVLLSAALAMSETDMD